MNSLRSRIKFRFPQGSFIRNVGILAGGTALGQGLVILASPLLTRLYTPEDFGLLAVYASLLSIFAVVASLRYELSIPLPDEDTVAANILALSLSIVLLLSLLSGAIAWLLADQITHWTNAPALKPYLWLLPMGVLAVGTYQALNYWAVRKKAFMSIARTKLNQGLAGVITQLGLGFLYVGPLGLLVGQVTSQAAGTATLAALALRRDASAIRQVSLQGMFSAARRYRRFPLYSTWSGLSNTLSSQIPILLLSFFFGPLVTGLYALGHRVLQTPMSLIGRSVSQVFFSSASEAARTGSLKQLTAKTYFQLVKIGLPPILVIGIAAPELFAFFFGDQWRDAGIYAQYLSPWLFLVFVSSPLSILPSILERQGAELFFQGSLLVGRIAALCIGGYSQNIALAIGLYAAFSALSWSYFMLWNMSLSGNPPRRILPQLTQEILVALPLLTPLILAKIFIHTPQRDLFIILASGVSVMLIGYRLIKRQREGLRK